MLINTELNSNQQTAVMHGEGPMMVLAGPGSGKTTVITHRIKFLIESLNISPSNILVITFTKAATDEMRKRFQRLMPDDSKYGKHVTFSTFHALFFRIIRDYYYTSSDVLLNEDERKNICREILNKNGESIDDDKLAAFLNEISFIKNNLMEINYYHSILFGTDSFISMFNQYTHVKEECGKIDFDDILEKCNLLLQTEPNILHKWQNKWKFILIDEFQDINLAQYRAITLLAQQNRNIFIVGDDDQSIYRFRGASPEFLLQFPKEYKELTTVMLNTNYRSSEQIIKVCNLVISRNMARYSKIMQGIGRDGVKPAVFFSKDGNEEAVKVANKIKLLQKSGTNLNDIAVIYRVNIQSRALTDTFMNFNIPFQVRGEFSSIYEHWIMWDICAYLKLSIDINDNDSLKRIINKPVRYINKSVIAATENKLNINPNKNLFNAIYKSGALKTWQLAKLDELIFFLNFMQNKKPHEAVKYIRQTINYDNYISEYCEYRKIGSYGLFEISNEILEASKSFNSIKDFISHIYLAAEQVKEKKKTRSKNNNDADNESVLLSTIHSVKGLEFDTVFIIGAVEGSIPYEKSKTDAELEEERRLLYVGLTRSKTNLFVSVVKYHYEELVKPTRFLDGILWKEKFK